MPSLPKRVKIGHLNVKVCQKIMREFDGLADFKNSRITIDPQLHIDRSRHTLLHECLHFILDNAGITMVEENIDAISSGLLCLFQDNECVTDYLFKKEKGTRHAK